MNGVSKNNNNNNTSPSHARRQALNRELAVPTVSNFFPLDRYYEAAEKVHESFQTCLEKLIQSKSSKTYTHDIDQTLDDAYVYGKRYCTFCLQAISQHNYYHLPKYAAVQKRHLQQISKVLDQLEVVVVKGMDDYETYKEQLRKERARKLAMQKEHEELLRFAALQERVEQQKKGSRQQQQQQSQQNGGSTEANVEASALSKLQLLSNGYNTNYNNTSAQQQNGKQERIPKDPSGEEPMGLPSTRYGMDEDEEDDERWIPALPPPLLPSSDEKPSTLPSAPPSYHQVTEERRRQGSNFWGPGSSSNSNNNNTNNTASHKPASAVPFPHPHRTTPPDPKIPFPALRQQLEQHCSMLKQQGRIQVTSLDTYQGRVGSSTNGCTVISALCVSHHLKNASSSNGSPSLTNAQIAYIIDRQCGPLLTEIRSKLGLGGHALIIPSDVHDHLVDRHLLPQDKFLGVAGGNILDTQHTGEFFKLLAQAPKLAAATLFFREHVISIVKYYDPQQQRRQNTAKKEYSYDLIDSMPGPGGNATRTSCYGLEALVVLVRWYAARKFSSSNATYVEQNEWNDSLADVDPRVFQAFVWGETAQ